MTASSRSLAAQPDILSSPLYRAVDAWMHDVWRPGFGRLSDPRELSLSPDHRLVAFTAELRTDLRSKPLQRVAVLDLTSGSIDVLEAESGSDKSPAWSPKGDLLAFLSDREQRDRYQVWIRNVSSASVRSGPTVEGSAEYVSWSNDGSRLLIGVAGLHADTSADTGSGSSAHDRDTSWHPEVDAADSEGKARWLCIARLGSDRAAPVSPPGFNVWEAAWLDSDRVAALMSQGTTESSWYASQVMVGNVDDLTWETIWSPPHQAQIMAASPNGAHIAAVSAIASDRGVVAGQLVLIDARSGAVSRVDTGSVDVTSGRWRTVDRIVFAGYRGLETVVGEVGLTGDPREIWRDLQTSGASCPEAVPYGAEQVVFVVESWNRAPGIVVADDANVRTVATFAHAGTEYLAGEGGILEPRAWTAPDGLTIQGWLAMPQEGRPPHPTVLEIHGGPVWLARNRWSARNILLPLLVSRGFAVLMPNFRGSLGRGAEFTGLIYGDMGGADLDDCLAGVDALVAEGIADRNRLGVSGGSYGGFAVSAIITRDHRFKAALALSPVTDFWSQHTTSNLGTFDELFLQDDPWALHGRYVERSPARHVERVRTPLLTVVGGQDRATPPGQGWQMHNGILEKAGTESVLVTYPEEGHGVRTYPALTDYCTRALSWFEERLLPVPRG